MTPAQLMKHYKNNKSLASREMGCSRAAIGNWLLKKSIPIGWQLIAERKTGGILKADMK